MFRVTAKVLRMLSRALERQEARRRQLETLRAPVTIQKIEVVIQCGDDPSRVARLTREALEKLARRPPTPPEVS